MNERISSTSWCRIFRETECCRQNIKHWTVQELRNSQVLPTLHTMHLPDQKTKIEFSPSRDRKALSARRSIVDERVDSELTGRLHLIAWIIDKNISKAETLQVNVLTLNSPLARTACSRQVHIPHYPCKAEIETKNSETFRE